MWIRLFFPSIIKQVVYYQIPCIPTQSHMVGHLFTAESAEFGSLEKTMRGFLLGILQYAPNKSHMPSQRAASLKPDAVLIGQD